MVVARAVERAVAGEMAVVVVVAMTTVAVAKKAVVGRAVERAVDWAVAAARAEVA
jgi:hypothetical protein